MGALTKKVLVEHLNKVLGFSKAEGKDIVNCFFNAISASLIRGESVKLSGFGNFKLRDKKDRPGRNPLTREYYLISSRRVVTFRAGKKLRKLLVSTPKRLSTKAKKAKE